MNEIRENWTSRSSFILAAIGSAVGLGNVWRFPYEAYSNGGSAFLLPFLVAMFVVGVPMLIMEFALGHLTQQASPKAFARINPKWEFVGWWPIVLSFVIVTYYSIILAWSLNFLYFSFQSPLPWTGHSLSFFYDDFLGNNGSFALKGIRLPIVVTLALTWIAMYFCIYRGVRVVSKVVLWTVTIPWVMLLILTIRSITLDGAIQGLEYYLEPDWVKLQDPKVWRSAFGQVFFSMSLAFGIMITYASFLHRKSDLNNNAMIVALSVLATSFISGIAVFATMGSLAQTSGVPVDQVLANSKSFGLAFVAFPEALSHLPFARLFSIVFFVALVFLGIDSAFSITEATLASLVDKTGWNRPATLAGISVVGFLIGLLFTTGSGLTWLGAIDSIVNEGVWGILFVGLAECVVVGWICHPARLRDHANRYSDWQLGRWWEYAIRYVIPAILAVMIGWAFWDDLHRPGGFIIDSTGNLIGADLLNICLSVILLLISVILGLWDPNKIKPVKEFD